MNRGGLSKWQRCHTCRCVRTALAQGLALDALLLVGLLGAVMFYPGRWIEVYTVVISTGVGKTVLSGAAAALKCATAQRLGQPPDQH